jgi:hypothetical protein
MTVRYTRLGCRVETTFVVCPNNSVQEHIVLSTEPQLSIEPDEGVGRSLGHPTPMRSPWGDPRRYRK